MTGEVGGRAGAIALRRPFRGTGWVVTRRLAVPALLVLIAASLLLVTPLHRRALAVLNQVAPIITDHPVVGPVLFVLLAALSAMFAFLSSTVLVPAALYAWGTVTTLLLLWSGWFVGGILTYAIGRHLGRPFVDRLLRPSVAARHFHHVRSSMTLWQVLLVQLAIPSDVGGYLLGLARCPLRTYLVALALAETPYALGAVMLADSLIQRRLAPLLSIGAAGILVTGMALRRLRSRNGERLRPC
jgi:uncharacterized membrane protein YdjX (TVP38/TMEM64 family)